MLKQTKEEENKEKDAKKKAKLTEKVRTMASTITGLHDGDYRLARVLDAVARLYLRVGDPTPADKENTVGDMCHQLSAVLSKLQYASSRLHCFVEIAWIDPNTNVGFLAHKKTQDGLEAMSRRLQSSMSRYSALKKKEETKDTSVEELKSENDRLRAELSKKTGESLQDFRKMYEAMVEEKASSSSFSWETKGKKKKGDAQAKSAGGKGGGRGKGGGKGDKERGKGRKRGKSGGKPAAK